MKPKEDTQWELKYLLKLIERVAPEVKKNAAKDGNKGDKNTINKKNNKNEKKETNSEGPVVMILTPATNRAIEIIKYVHLLQIYKIFFLNTILQLS